MNKIKRLSVFICLVLLGAGMVLLAGLDMQHAAAAPQPEVWLPAIPLPEPLAANLVHCADMPDSFYMVGGILEGNITSNTLYRYDITTPEWVQLEPLPAPRRAVAATCYQGKIYAAGGVDYYIYADLFIYDIATGTWTTGPDLPDIVWGAAMGAWDGKLHLIGGTRVGDPYTPESRVDVFDIATGTWTAEGGQDMPTATSFFGSVQAGPYLYAVGGYSGDFNYNVNQTQRYDMRTSSWEVGPTFTSAKALGPLAATGTSLYLLGGDLNGGGAFDATDLVDILDLSTWPVGAWADLGDPLPAVNLYAATTCSEAITDGETWVVGGSDGSLNLYDDVYYRPTGESCFDFYFGDLQPEGQSATGSTDEIITYTLSIHNDGTLIDTYDITASSVWDIAFPATVGPLAAGESAEFVVSVEIPAGGLPGESDTAFITITSQGDPTAADEASITTAVTEWMEATPIPHQTGLAGYVQCPDDPDHFYVVGGADDWGSATRLVWRYEISTDTWLLREEFPALRIFTTSTCYQGKIYSYDWGLFIYDIASNTWTIGPFPQRLVEGNALGVWDGKLFVVGGTINNYIPDPRVDIYDIASGTWLAEGGTDMPIGTNFSGWVQAGRYLYISGGWLSISSGTDVTQRYDMATDMWETALSTLPSEMGAPGLVINGGNLYSLGGNTDFVYAPLDQVLVMDLADWPNEEWEPYYDFLPFANSGMAPFCSEGKTGGEIWSVGGGYSDPDGTTHIFDTNLYHPTGEPCTDFYFGDLQPENLATTGMPSELITYTLSIHNNGTLSDTYEITANAAWNTTFPATVGPLAAGESAEILVSVEVPAEGLPGESDIAIITATSQGDPTAADEASITTAVTEWVEASPIPQPTVMAGFAQCLNDPDHFYVIGGADDMGNPTQLLWRYEISTDSWESLATFPMDRVFPSSTCYEDKIYSFDTYLFIYNIAGDTWSAGPTPPRNASGNALGVWDGKIFVVGGNLEETGWLPDPRVDIYDIASGTWLAEGGMDMPVATAFSGWVQAGPYLFISGGWLSGSSDTDITQRYNLATDSWEVSSATLPAGMGISGLVVNDQKLYNLGGSTNYVFAPLSQVLVMDLAAWPGGEWEPYYDFLPFDNSGMAPFCTEGKTGGEIWSVTGGYLDEYGNIHGFDTNLYHPTGEPCVHHGVDLSGPMQGYGEIGSSVNYNLSITNTGTIIDYYSLTISTTWQAGNILGGPGPVEPGETIHIVIGVDVPAEAMPGDQGSSLVTVSSLRDPSIMDTTLITTIVPKYDVGLDPDSLALGGFQGETVAYTLTVSNLGNIADTVSFTYTGNTWEVQLPVMSIDLDIGESASVVVYVTVPMDAGLGDTDVLNLTATSAGDPSISDSAMLTTTAIGYEVGLSPDSLALNGYRGETLTYTLTVSNLGNIADTVSFTYTGNTWDALLPVTSLDLDIGESKTVTVYVTIPMDAGIGDTDVLNMIATSAGDPSASDSATLTTTAIGYEVGLSPDSLALSGSWGEIVAYTLTVSNLGNIADTISFTYTGNTWEVLLPVTSLDLDIGESAEVVVYVTVPEDAWLGDINTLILTATSAGDPSVSDSSTLIITTTGYRMLLPLAMMNFP